MRGYKKLEIYQLAHGLAIEVHNMSLSLPPLERFEEGSQIRRSAKSVSANIVEGYAHRKYKNEFIRYLFRSYGSAEETIEHLEILLETRSLENQTLFRRLFDGYNRLCGKILRYIQAVEKDFDIPNFLKRTSFEPQNPKPKPLV